MHVDGKPSSFGGIVAAWAGSIALHAGVVLGWHWAAPPLAPVPEARPELRVEVIESVRAAAPARRSREATDADAPRAVTRPSVRVTPLRPPVVVSRAGEITSAGTAAVELSPAPRPRMRAVRPTSERRRSRVAVRRVDPVETEVAVRTEPEAPAPRPAPAVRNGVDQARTVTTAGPVVVEARPSRSRPAPRMSVTDRGGVRAIDSADRRERRRVQDGPTTSRLPEREVVTTVRSGAAVGVRTSTESRAGSGTAVVRTEKGTTAVRMLDTPPSGVREAPQPESVVSKPAEAPAAGVRTVEVVKPRAAPRARQAAPEVVGLPVRPRSSAGSNGPVSDYGWLARTMHHRIAERKRYPHRARMNQWEGRVVLRAVIRDDGELAALSIETSSGHPELDEEAMGLVRRVCPVSLTHPLGRPEITMHIPITYTLDH